MKLPYIDIIKQIMVEQNLSQQKLADILGVNQTTISQWLLGNKKPGYDSIMLLYEKFDVEPNSLFDIH
ncbi:MAG: helix-turn-helix transcriptional regulator [Clostridia bacterium]|nr:helix-turn-helix transcriptional regulator [Clostridia bacterium]